MLEKNNGFKSGLSTQIPTAIALLLAFILGNIQWSSTINRGMLEQTEVLGKIGIQHAEQIKLLNQMVESIEKLTEALNLIKI